MTLPARCVHPGPLGQAASPALTFANPTGSLGGLDVNGRLPAHLESKIRAIGRRSSPDGLWFLFHEAPLGWSCYREIPVLAKN